MTLTEFLRARIAEDEESWKPDPFDWSQTGDLNEGYIQGLHERLLAECAAKRAVLDLLDEQVIGWDELTVGYSPEDWLAKQVAQAMALPYADHPDFDEAWRP